VAATWIKAPVPMPDADDATLQQSVRAIIQRVRADGDAALRAYATEFDGVTITDLRVSDTEIEEAGRSLPEDLLKDMAFGIERVRRFAEAQRATLQDLDVEVLPGVHLGHRHIPVQTVGAYVPGGRYPLLSSAQMAVIPAKVAGVQRIIVCTPTRRDGRIHPAVLWAAHLSGADEIYRTGGAQAIAAMAYGTESIPKADKVVGPGNRYVTEAKRQVIGEVGIDLLAGPSEIEIIADDTARPQWVAADLLAQAEHDVDARAILITTSRRVAEQTLAEVEHQLQELSTAAIAGESWRRHGQIILVDTMDDASRVSDDIGPEHLEVHAADPHAFLARLRNYGSLFIGEEAAVIFSDKVIGTNHILPTRRAARHTGGVWVGTFLKTLTHQWLTPEAAGVIAPYCVRQSAREGLQGHRGSAALRLPPA
jgi:histidinol dehydrogenase/sulfopropanediol 3-dehydrogenase